LERARAAARAASGQAVAPPSSVMNSRVSFDDLVGKRKQLRRYIKAQHLGGLEIDD
jgi:hypothetical protein